MAGRAISSGTFASAVANLATVVIPYPSGTSEADFDVGQFHTLLVEGAPLRPNVEFLVSFGAAGATVQNTSGQTWPAGAAYSLAMFSRLLPDVVSAVITGADEFTDWTFVRGGDSAAAGCVGTAGAAFGGATVEVHARFSGSPETEFVIVDTNTDAFLKALDPPVGGLWYRVGVPSGGFASATSLTATISNATDELGRDRAL